MITRNQLFQKKVMPNLVEFIFASLNKISRPRVKALCVQKIETCIDNIYARIPSDKKSRVFLICIYNKIKDEMFSPNFYNYTIFAFRNKKFVDLAPPTFNMSKYSVYINVLYNKLYTTYLEAKNIRSGINRTSLIDIKDGVLASAPVIGDGSAPIIDTEPPAPIIDTEPPAPIIDVNGDIPPTPTVNNNKQLTTNDMELTPKQIKKKKRNKTIFTIIAIIILLLATFFGLKKLKIIKI